MAPFTFALLSVCTARHNMRVVRLCDMYVEVVAWMLVVACASQCAWTGKQWLTCACHLRVAVQRDGRALRLTDGAACRLCISCEMQVHIHEAYGLCIVTISPQAFRDDCFVLKFWSADTVRRRLRRGSNTVSYPPWYHAATSIYQAVDK